MATLEEVRAMSQKIVGSGAAGEAMTGTEFMDKLETACEARGICLGYPTAAG